MYWNSLCRVAPESTGLKSTKLNSDFFRLQLNVQPKFRAYTHTIFRDLVFSQVLNLLIYQRRAL